MGSGNMALSEGLLLCLVGVAVGQFSEALLETSTPVPILRYIDSQNADGSYTYGFEGADGTYKIETRLADRFVANTATMTPKESSGKPPMGRLRRAGLNL